MLSGTQNRLFEEKAKETQFLSSSIRTVLKKGTQKKKTSLNDSRYNFCLAQEFLDNQVNRVLNLVTKGVPGALSWKKVLMN